MESSASKNIQVCFLHVITVICTKYGANCSTYYVCLKTPQPCTNINYGFTPFQIAEKARFQAHNFYNPLALLTPRSSNMSLNCFMRISNGTSALSLAALTSAAIAASFSSSMTVFSFFFFFALGCCCCCSCCFSSAVDSSGLFLASIEKTQIILVFLNVTYSSLKTKGKCRHDSRCYTVLLISAE